MKGSALALRFLLAGGGFVALLGCITLAVAQATERNESPGPMPPGAISPTQVQPPAPAADRAGFTFSGELTQGGWILGQAPAGTATARLDDKPLSLDREGNFFAAFDRDAGPSAMLVAALAAGGVVKHQLVLSPRAWDIERVDVARIPGGATEAFMAVRQLELVRIAAARSADHEADGWQQRFIWPTRGRISGRFGSQRIYRGGEAGSYHSGLDIATGESGTPYVAPADGVVVLAATAPFSLEGLLLIIDHGGGLNSAFLHSSRLAVKEGDRVRQGQYIGNIGMTGRASGPHLHWSVTWRQARLDPLLLLGPSG